MFRLFDGRTHFWQWDCDQKLVVSEAAVGTAIHFANDGMSETLTVLVKQEGAQRVCSVPNSLLTEAKRIKVYAYVDDERGARTIRRREFMVKEREKPAGYIYKETELYTLQTALQNLFREALADGSLKGKDGKDGKDGVGIEELELISSYENEDTYALHYTNGAYSEFTIRHGKDGVGVENIYQAETYEYDGRLRRVYNAVLTDGTEICVGEIADGKDGRSGYTEESKAVFISLTDDMETYTATFTLSEPLPNDIELPLYVTGDYIESNGESKGWVEHTTYVTIPAGSTTYTYNYFDPTGLFNVNVGAEFGWIDNGDIEIPNRYELIYHGGIFTRIDIDSLHASQVFIDGKEAATQEFVEEKLSEFEAPAGDFVPMPENFEPEAMGAVVLDNGVAKYFPLNFDSADPNCIPIRDGAGHIILPTQDASAIDEGYPFAVSGEAVYEYVNAVREEIEQSIGEIGAALEAVIELQDYYTGATFDELHEYAQGVASGGES